MPFAMSDEVRIHYELEGVGPPLLLYHGYRGSLDRWYESGYVELLAPRFQLILIDARGHGRSDRPVDAGDYALKRVASDIQSVLDDVGVQRTHFLGYSMGGRAGLALAAYAPERLISLAAGGTYAFAAEPALRARAMREIERLGDGSSIEERAYLAWLQRQLVEPGLDVALTGCAAPTLIYCGEHDDDHVDPARRTVGLLAAASFAVLPGLDHNTAFERVDVVGPLVYRFLTEGEI